MTNDSPLCIKTQSRTNCSRPWWSNYEKYRLLSGLFATDVDATVSTYFRLLHDNLSILCAFLSRLPKVDLIILEGGNVRPYVRTSVRTSVRPPQKVSSISMKFGIQVEVDEWCTTVCRVAGSKVQVKVTSPWKFEFLPFSKPISSAIYNGSWQMTTNS